MTSHSTPPSDGKTADVAGSAAADNGKPPVAANDGKDASSIDAPDPTKPPDAAVRWMARNCPSNVDLATLSNVCVRWRRVVAATITDDLLRPYANHLSGGGGKESDVAKSGEQANGDGGDSHGTENAKNGAGKGQNGGRRSDGNKGGTSATDIVSCSRSDLAKLYPVASLLLPEMAMELLERRKDSMINSCSETGGGNGGDNTAGYSSEDGEKLVPIKGGEADEGVAEADAKGAKDGAAVGEENDIDEHTPAAATVDGEGQFCLAWFAPSGIQIQSVRVGDDGDDHSVSSSSSEGIPDTDAASRRSSITPPFGPSGQETYDLSETEEVAADKDKARRRGYLSGKDSSGGGGAKGGGGGGSGGAAGTGGAGGAGGARGPSPAPDPNSPLRRRPPMNRTVATGAGAIVKKKKCTDDVSGRLQTCALGWSSYLSAMDVLLPFGFSTSFVRSTLDHVLELSALQWSTGESNTSDDTPSVEKSGPFDNLMATPITSSEPPKATFAVRGCTLARPDGYCLRWDEDEQDIEASLLQSDALASGNGMNSAGQGQTSSSREENDRRRWEYRRRRARQLLKQRKRERKRVMRERLPRMITSTREKSPSYLGEDSQHGFDGRGGRRQRSIQFLNADGDHAVRLRTTPFECGTVRSPVTIFCVAVATEDGCFFSGLRNRFELGHLYPQNPRDALVDMSPICLVTNQREDSGSQQAQVVVSRAGNSGGTGALLSGSEGRKYFDDSCHSSIPSHMDSDDSSDDSSDDDESSEGEKCSCRFCSTRINADECDDEPDENIISRGLLGPGSWHCYVAIFDGENSVIRVDGITEPQTETEVCIPRNTPGLDGLTIGSDHVFDMSLCYGGGDEGEGEGAISELAVFKGRLPLEDIERMERYLMKKHGISPCVDQHQRWQEDEWRRQSYALIAQPPPYRVRGEPVPLRVAANHRSVAWHRNCEVTGKEIAVSRIGCRYGAGSSDW